MDAMQGSERKVIVMQWVVIAVLVAGAGVGGFLLMRKADGYRSQVDAQQGNEASLREQLRQAQHPTPPPSAALPEATGNGGGAAP